MPPPDSAMFIYRYFMEEIKERLDAAAQTVLDLRAGRYPHKHFLGAEFCFLQLRMIYEAVALGCVAVHEKMGRLREFYQADALMKHLGSLHSEFYPKPVTERIEGDTLHVQPTTEPYLTKERLIAEYGRLGKKLHRGKIEDILFKRPKVYDLDEVIEQLNLTTALLEVHYIMVAQAGHMIRVVLHDPGDGQVHVNPWTPNDPA